VSVERNRRCVGAPKTFQASQWAHLDFFGSVRNQLDGDLKDIFLFRTSDVSVEPHIKVVGAASPDASALGEY